MAAKPQKGTKQVNAELSEELLDQLKAYCEERGQTIRYVIERALIRHLDNPPPLMPDPPLPPAPPEPMGAKPTRGKGGRK